MKLDVKVASIDAFDAVKSKAARVCPLICDHGYKADGDRCAKISCAPGSFVNDDNECEKKRDKPIAKREEPRAPLDRTERSKTEPAPTKPQVSGQIVCNNGGCRPVQRGCRIEQRPIGGRSSIGGNVEVCD